MIKRMNKLTALLVAATAVASIVPTGVSAADYKRIESKDGTIYNAVAFKDGKFFVDGNVKDGDTDAAYYLNDGKYSELDNIDTGVDVDGIYSDKYLSVDGGDYYIDLETGKVIDEDLVENNLDDLAVSLRKQIKDKADDRYTTEHSELKSVSDFTLLEGAKFANAWYGVKYDGNNVYTDIKGNYIDADYNLGKIKVEVTTGSSTKSVTLNNTEDTEKSITDGQKVSAKIVDANVIGQDDKNIYRTATIEISAGTDTVAKINNVDVTAKDGKVEFKVIQKISKAQASDDIDGAKYAKTVANYAITNEKGVDATAELADMSFNIVDGKLVAYKTTESNGKTNVTVKTVKFSTERGYTYTEIENADDQDATAFDIDVDGNMWALDGGFVYKFDNADEWTKVYKVDGSMDQMSVYNKDNMVVWNENDEVYSVIGNKDESGETEDSQGWVQAEDGSWTFVKEDGTKATGWLNDNGTWFYLNSNGAMMTGWQNVNGTWYYLNPVSDGTRGAMKTGWINDNGTWYYTNASGAMQTGWQNVNGTWYFMQGSGAMQTGWLNDNGTWYYLQASGAMKTGWLNDNGTWYFLNASGKMLSNTVVDGYKLGANGAWIR
ncbi:N-acetylmuramoyl-L-alanine amidase family protein [Clostridium botulinum]|uniref:N-acetylmuramoyl-L-alanine amidase family protein n=1 Tax=Clostridium botulinum TaxID=1491 RepID=UPI002247111A|nr:N-acetylmuramoyl-L-alanine amidase family protein [Clostridium botulinum]UZP03112.1 N-acetylmuramoyl-L-alanine amidase family protein [Clostridium botulinum]UZP06470.1 N-acetylmuramoyl-L-alanine amidase family protein [Clostridium botulinum]UZP09851.1 N-acetylmuramoyl-L-alanine amidase family protein [Clostridium botulinum]